MNRELPEFNMDGDAMYKEEVFTDRKMGSIRRLTPVDGDGNADASRSVLYIGSSQIMTPAGALPLGFEIEADSLADAASKFGDLAQSALGDTLKELEEMRRDQQSSIVVPGAGGGGAMGGIGGAGGGAPGGGAGFGGLKMP